MKKFKKQDEETKLQAACRKIANSTSEYDSIEKWADHLQEYGCVSGMIGDLTYYEDTIKFYKKHIEDINALLSETLEITGVNCPAQLFGEKWDSEDSLVLETTNQNLLCWFAFEETINQLKVNL